MAHAPRALILLPFRRARAPSVMTPTSSTSHAPEQGTWWGHLRVLAWTALILVALEVLAEVRAYRRGWDTLIFGQASAGAGDEHFGFGPTDAFPFRSRLAAVERTPGVLRVWIASASYALGGNLPAEEIFAVRLGDMLDVSGQPTQVLNAGRVGYAIPDSVAELERLGPHWRPDVAVLYHLTTDVDELSRLLLSRRGLAAAAGAEGLDWGTRFVERSTLRPLLKEHVSSRVTLLRPLADSLEPGGEAAFTARVRSFVALCRRLGVRPVLCTCAVSHDRENPEQLPRHVFRFNLRVSRRGWHDTIERWNEVLRRVAREEGVPLVDVAAELLGRGEFFVDFVHFTARGHAEVARLLAPAVRPEGMPPEPRVPAPPAPPAAPDLPR